MSRRSKKKIPFYVVDNKIKDLCRVCGEIHTCLTSNCMPCLFASITELSKRFPDQPLRRATQEEFDTGQEVTADQFVERKPAESRVILPPWVPAP